ncbi:hypothetical protein C8F01DRAFT_1292938 [Mycena amicta]|nr:hypothetical protein C8F01DRAFT_1292938 [Mycena amicta]
MSGPRWFPDTFDGKSYSQSQVEDALAGSIGDVIRAISESLTNPVRTSLNQAREPLEKVQILFSHLDAQSSNIVLVHAFQQAILKWGGLDYMLNWQVLSSFDNQPLDPLQNGVPFIRNCPLPSEFFQGRKDILQQLDSLFQRTEQKEQKVVLLYGLGGAGKTQIALKFIADSGTRFTDQFKINAGSVETIEAGYKQLAIAKKLGDTVEAAQTWLKANKQEWLVLFDNADKRDLNLGRYLPKYHHGNILITSRNPDLWAHTGSPGKAIKISDLAIDDAGILLLNRAGVELEMGENKKHAAMIAKSVRFFQELHCFPLAIVQAGAFIGKSPRLKQNIFRYLQLYQKNKAALLSEKPAQSTDDYDETVHTTWKMSFAQLLQVEPLAAQFLQLCSFIHFEGISEDIFERASTYEMKDRALAPPFDVLKPSLEFLSSFRDTDTTWNSLVFERITSELCGYSLMAWQNGAYSIHPLVHHWARTTITDVVGFRKLIVGLLGMAAACSWGLVQKIGLVLHLAQLAIDIDLVDTGFEVDFAKVFYGGGMFRRAEALEKNVLSRRVSLLGTEHPNTVQAMANLAATYCRLGQYTEAEKLEQQVLEKRTQLLGAEHPATVKAMANLAVTYRSLGQYTEAEKLEEQVLEKRTQLLGAEHPNTVQAMANLAATYHSLGRYTEAEKLEEQVLEKRTELFGAEHPDTVRAMGNLAVTYHCLGQYTEAEKLEEQVLEKRTELLGAEHPDTMRAMANLAVTYHRLGRYTEAERLEEQVLEKHTQLFGTEHPDTMLAMANLAVTYRRLGQYPEAEKLEEQVLEKRTQLLGAEHPDTVRAMANLAATYHRLGQYTEAEKLEQQVLEKRTQLLGAEHPATVQAMGNLAMTYHCLGQYTEAEKLEEQVLEKRMQLLGTEHPDTMQAMANLAATYHSLGWYTEAEKLEEQVLEKYTQLLGTEHPDTVQAMANLAATYCRLGQYTEAEKLEEQVLEKRTQLLGAEHPDTVRAMANLAVIYHHLGQYTETERLEEQVLERKNQTQVVGIP